MSRGWYGVFSDLGVKDSLIRASWILGQGGDEKTPRLLKEEIDRLRARIDLKNLAIRVAPNEASVK